MNAFSFKQLSLKPQDLVVTLKLSLARDEPSPFAKLANELSMSASEVHAAVKRAELSRLVGRTDARLVVNRSALREFVLHGVRYAFPPILGSLTRGMPTGAASAPLAASFEQSGTLAHVWPDAHGAIRGLSLCPLYPSVPEAARLDPLLWRMSDSVSCRRLPAPEPRVSARQPKLPLPSDIYDRHRPEQGFRGASGSGPGRPYGRNDIGWRLRGGLAGNRSSDFTDSRNC